MPDPPTPTTDEDARHLGDLGYAQELDRRLGPFSNFALSLTIICILSGGVTSFHLGLCSVGGAAIGLGWPLVGLYALAVAATMAQVASAFPTAGGLYHWASVLGGRGWGWLTAWLNLAGLVAALAAVNVGTWEFAVGSVAPFVGLGAGTTKTLGSAPARAAAVALVTASQAWLNHRHLRLTTRLTDLSGYLIGAVTATLTASVLAFAPGWHLDRLVTFSNFSGTAGGGVWPATHDLARLFALGLLLPAYTLTGFDASAHAAEETVGASRAVPRGIVRSVAVSAAVGWVMLSALVASVPDLRALAAGGGDAFPRALRAVLPPGLAGVLGAAIAAAMYGCGLGAVTSASRMAYAFARDGGLPFSSWVRQVSPGRRSPAHAAWAVAASAWLFTLWTPFYSTISAVCVIFLDLSYVVPTVLGAWAYGRTWTRMGPWDLGRAYRPLAAVSAVGCAVMVFVSIQPPNDRSAWIVVGTLAALSAVWFGGERRRFAGPPVGPVGSAPSP